jgi:predicted RNA-binding Zn ribbon-like protein
MANALAKPGARPLELQGTARALLREAIENYVSGDVAGAAAQTEELGNLLKQLGG